MIKFGNEITQFLVEYAEDIIFKLKDRKKDLVHQKKTTEH